MRNVTYNTDGIWYALKRTSITYNAYKMTRYAWKSNVNADLEI